jgi:hypothetical protein
MKLQHISTDEQIEDILTKPLFREFFFLLQGEASRDAECLPH